MAQSVAELMSLLPSPLPIRWAMVGASALGIVGAVVGLIIGLCVYAPTAVFAVVEVGLPATIVGGMVGFVVGSVLLAARRILHR